ncbi:hypothetical protein E2C01_051369 [Portunus trituberculatus]|uniref:Uncharacterized protein n=1 Tax=Portunus trituberculatus TaxID=210409 RepID=A0A5B7GAT2_PORTR|nr:hypothetical protein [Portunus trituberculatus]
MAQAKDNNRKEEQEDIIITRPGTPKKQVSVEQAHYHPFAPLFDVCPSLYNVKVNTIARLVEKKWCLVLVGVVALNRGSWKCCQESLKVKEDRSNTQLRHDGLLVALRFGLFRVGNKEQRRGCDRDLGLVWCCLVFEAGSCICFSTPLS